MSNIASPRPSVTLSSRRGSNSTDNTTRSVSTSRAAAAPQGSVRRNRVALRDYYGLKVSSVGQEKHEQSPLTPVEAEEKSELDREGFDPDKYVKHLLASEGLEGVLRVEARLVSEIKNLDGEKKALVYDNYSKLIDATKTIRKMRTSMDPLTPTTSALTPAISHIAETASALSRSLRDHHGSASSADDRYARGSYTAKQTVGWVLATPERFRTMIAEGHRDDAEAQWTKVSALLDKWSSARGVDDVRAKCLEALSQDKP